MKFLMPLFFLFLILACHNQAEKKQKEAENSFDFDKNKNETTDHGFLLDSSAYYVDSIIRQFIQSSLGTSKKEKYTYTVHKAMLNKDKAVDAIIAINRLDFAQQKAKETGAETQAEKMAYMGPFNAFIFYDGRSNTFSPPTIVPSSPLLPLDIHFEHISSNQHKDAVIDFRIRNSSYKEVYFLFNNRPKKVFQWKNFDGLGSDSEEAYEFRFKLAQRSNVKDIVVYQANLGTHPNKIDAFTYKPEIKTSNDVIKRFFYVDKEGKYFSAKSGL